MYSGRPIFIALIVRALSCTQAALITRRVQGHTYQRDIRRAKAHKPPREAPELVA